MGGNVNCDVGGEGEHSKQLDDSENTVGKTLLSSQTEGFYGDEVVKFPRECIHPRLRNVVEAEGHELLQQAAKLLEEHGTPADVARRVTLRQLQGSSFSLPPLENIDNTCAIPPITPFFASWSTEHVTLHDADEELGHRCQFLLFITDEAELYSIPYDLQRRIVPLLYSWVVDWDFLRRHTSSWGRVAECFCRVVQCRRKHFSLRPDFSLQWQPLVKILMSVFFQSGRVLELNDFHGMRKLAGKHLERICELAALHFDDDALEGLWETFAPYFSSEREEAPLMLCLFSHLVPIHRLVDDKTGVSLPLTERIVRFLLEDSFYWQQQSKNWLSYSLKVILQMSFHHVGLLDFDKYAEQLFSAILFQLRLPIAEGKKVPSAPSGFGVLSAIPFFTIQKGEMCSAYGFIGNMLPCKTNSPLWNQLRRFILATSVFINPTTANTKVAFNLFTFFGSFVAAVHQRMSKQAGFEIMRSNKRTKFKGRHISEPYLWNRETVDTFVTLMAPVLLSFLHHRFDDAPRIVGLLASLAPEVVQPLILPYVSVGLRGGVGSQAQRTVALLLLVKTLYPLSECRATFTECWRFLADVLPLLLPWVSPGAPKLSELVLDVVFATCSITKLEDILGCKDVERDFAVAFVERVFECSAHVEIGKGSTFQSFVRCINALCSNVSDDTLEFCVLKAVKEAEVRGSLSKAQAVSSLLEPFARRATERIMHWATRSLIPPLQSVFTPASEVQWCAHLLAGCVRGAGFAVFLQRNELLRCIQCQASRFTERERLLAAATVYSAMYQAFTRAVCVETRALNTTEKTDGEPCRVDGDEIACDRSIDAFEMSIGFCRSNNVRITWREASEEHIIYLVDVYVRLVEDIVNVIRNVDQYCRSQSVGQSEASQSFCHSDKRNEYSLVDSTKKSTYSNVDDTVGQKQLTETETKVGFGVDGTDTPTPRSVLRGVLFWLQLLLEINQELRAWCCSGIETQDMIPWWLRVSKMTFSFLFPFSPDSLFLSSPKLLLSALPFMHEKIHDFLIEHSLQSVVGNLAEKGSVASILGLDYSNLVQGKVVFGNLSVSNVDLRGSRCVLSMLAEQCNIVSRTALGYDTSHRFIMRPNIFTQFVAEPLKRRRYFPLMYWQLKAEYFSRFFHSLLMHKVSPKRLSELVSITHTLLFSPYRSLKLDCFHILSDCINLLGPEATRYFFARHFAFMKQIIELLRKEHDSSECALDNQNFTTHAPFTGDNECDNKLLVDEPDNEVEENIFDICTDENGTKSNNSDDNDNSESSAEGNDNKNEESNNKDTCVESFTSVTGKNVTKQHFFRLKSELDAILPVFPIARHCSYFYQDHELIRRQYELLLYLPDHVFSKLVDAGFFLKTTADLKVLPSMMENSRAVLLCDELLLIASKCSITMPDRALICLVMVVVLYRPSRVALLSPRSVMILFRLTLNSHKRLHATSFHVLHALFLALKELHPKAYVLTRRGALEDAGNADFFCHRYEVMKQKCSSFYGMRDFGLVFLPKSMRIDAKDVEQDMFGDGGDVLVDAKSVVRRNMYVWGSDENDEREKQYVNTKDEEDEKQKAHEQVQNQQSLRKLIAQLSGICHTECDSFVATGAAMESVSEAKIRGGWIWNVVQLRQDQNTFSKYRMQFWKALGKLCGVEVSVPFFTRLVRLLLKDFVKLAQSNNDAAKESPKWLFSCISDILIAAIRISKRHSSVRLEALTCYVETLMFVCTSCLVPREVHDSFLSSVSELRATLKASEVWFVYVPLFEALPTTNAETTSARKETFVTNQHVFNDNNNEITNCNNGNVWYSNMETDAKMGSLSFAGCTLAMVRVLSVIAQLLCVFAHEINVELLSKLCQQIIMRRDTLLCSEVMSVRYCVALVIQQIARLSLHQNVYIPANSDVLSSLVKFFDSLERMVELPLLPAFDSVLSTLAPWSQTPAPGLEPHPFSQSFDVAASGPFSGSQIESCFSFFDGFRLDCGSIAAATPPVGLAAIKTFLAYWHQPPQPLLNARIHTIIPLFVRALDIQLQDVDDFYELVQATLNSIVYIRLPKDTIHNVLELLCDILEEKRPYGKTWQAKVIISQTLCLLLFINLHRIGRFAFMESVSRAALRSIGHGDGRVRKEGKQLLAVLTKVASVEQIQAIIHGYFRELREISNITAVSVTNAAPQSSVMLPELMRRRRRSALLIALCAILSASPGVVPPYAPRLMERLGAFANDPAQEVQRAVKQAFGDWWRSHREGWELEHKSHFSPAQIEVIAPLMAPSYLV